jgi:hypothetical protein
VASGIVFFYYRTYDENGQRLCGHSTGQTTRTAEREFCNRLNREGKLIPQKQDKIIVPSFFDCRGDKRRILTENENQSGQERRTKKRDWEREDAEKSRILTVPGKPCRWPFPVLAGGGLFSYQKFQILSKTCPFG